MATIAIGGAGGAPSEGVIYSLKCADETDLIYGLGSEKFDLILSDADNKFLIPYASEPNYKEKLLSFLNSYKPDLIHFQNDSEIYEVSQIREEILKTGTKLFMPDHQVIDTCVHKHKTYLAFKDFGLPVPLNILINDVENLTEAFRTLGDNNGFIWLRSASIGGGGKGAVKTNDLEFAKQWINRFEGWGSFLAAQLLSEKTATWQSIWYEGELVVAQSRARQGWVHSSRSMSGVTGVTKIGVTIDDSKLNSLAINAVMAVSDKPHGIFGVDFTYDQFGMPNPTEINISRFFTTIRFFTEAGLNMPEIFKNLALKAEFPQLDKKINPLTPGLSWIRSMDKSPKLIPFNKIDSGFKTL
jgi:carbamoyl-phosphate synthase large subunit